MSGNFRCSVCDEMGHDRRHCPKRVKKKRACKVCEDQPHRRDAAPLDDDYDDDDLEAVAPTLASARVCRGCGKPYVPETPMTIWEAMALPREDRRAVP